MNSKVSQELFQKSLKMISPPNLMKTQTSTWLFNMFTPVSDEVSTEFQEKREHKIEKQLFPPAWHGVFLVAASDSGHLRHSTLFLILFLHFILRGFYLKAFWHHHAVVPPIEGFAIILNK